MISGKKRLGTFRKATAKGNGAHEVGMGARNEFADLLSAFDESLREGSVQRSGFDRRAHRRFDRPRSRSQSLSSIPGGSLAAGPAHHPRLAPQNDRGPNRLPRRPNYHADRTFSNSWELGRGGFGIVFLP